MLCREHHFLQMCSFLTVIIIVITKIICPNCQEGINDFFPLIPYLLAAVSFSHCLILQQVASDIKGIFYHTNKLQLLHDVSGSVYLKSSGEKLRCLRDMTDCKSECPDENPPRFMIPVI